MGGNDGVGGVARIIDPTNNNLFFPVNKERPSSLTDISLTTQHRVTGTPNSSGEITLTAASLISSDHVDRKSVV